MRAVSWAVVITLVAPSVVAATKDDETRKRAEEAFRDKRYAEALALYRALSESSKDPALLYNIARCHHELGDYASAHAYYTRFAVEAPLDIRAKVPHLDEKIAFVVARTAVLDITADVVGATIAVDGKTVSSEPVRVNAGRVTVVGTKPGHKTDTRTIEVVGGTRVAVRLELVSLETGVLRVHSSIAATVSIDGKVIGTTPTELVVRPGPHRVEASASGYERWTGSVIVPAGGTQTQTITLKETSSGVPWWLWVGVSAVVVGGVVITYALVTERSPDSGSYAPGQVATGLRF